MDALLVEGDEIELTPDIPWSFVAPSVRVRLTALPGHLMKAKGKSVLWESDIHASALSGWVQQPYTTPGFDAPGMVTLVKLELNPKALSASVKDGKKAVATVATSGTFSAVVFPAAMNPSTGVPDAAPKTGTWSIATEKQSVASSGQPAGADQDGEDGVAGLAGAGGSNAAQAAAAENAVHFVAVVVEDIDGNKLASHHVAISTPDGRRSAHTLTEGGAARVDGIRADGQALVQLLDAQIRPPVKRPTAPWVAFTVIDENGQPADGAKVELTLPDGTTLVQVVGAKGAVRFENLKEDGECSVRLLPPEEAVEVGDSVGGGADDGLGAGAGDDAESGVGAGGSEDPETGPVLEEGTAIVTWIDETGAPIEGLRVIARLSDGDELDLVTDADGKIEFENAPPDSEFEVSLVRTAIGG